MVRADLLLFGYFVLVIDAADRGVATDILLKAGISAAFDRKGRLVIPYHKKDNVVSLFEGEVKFSVSEPLGLYGQILKHRRRFGIFIGVLLIAVLFIISSDTVWDVRVEGAYLGNEEEIRRELSEAGLGVGKRWSKLDKNQIEINMLTSSHSVAWLNINRRGTVAYVKVSDKITYPEEEKPVGYANIVAVRDCVIEEIIVENGYPMVKKGESVRAGEILISGVIPTELGGGFCYASGQVIGRYNESLSVFVMRSVSEKVYSERTLALCKVNFFAKGINIFKKYGQPNEECDIISEREDLILGKRLPLSIDKTYFCKYETVTKELSDSELILCASEKLREALLLFLSDKEAQRMVTSGDFSEDGYEMVCDAVVSSDVTKIQEFKVE